MGFRKSFKQKQSGQASIFMAIFITTMIMLLAFSTNIGMLVHAKINLQNAADAAAYAGAAVQARQLTAVSYLNWEMRRALKEFLWDYMVRGNRHQTCYPRDQNGTIFSRCRAAFFPGGAPGPDRKYSFAFQDPRNDSFFNEPGEDFLPSVCIIYDSGNNYCQKFRVAGIPEFQSPGGVLVFVNPIINAVQNATQIIIDKKKRDCTSRTVANKQFLFAWLIQTDPRPLPITVGADSQNPMTVTGSIEGLGFLVRMALLRARVDNFEEKLNVSLAREFGDGTVNDQSIGNMLGSPKGSEYFERSIQAFLSARNNLPTRGQEGSNGMFSDIQLTEIIPTQPSAPVVASPGLENPPILAKFDDLTDDLFLAVSEFQGGRFVNNAGECQQIRRKIEIPGFPLGIVKNPNILTYYAVRLQAKARLLFSPFGDNGIVNISAYSAAKPFGSRVGIDLMKEPDRLVAAVGQENGGQLPTGAFNAENRFPNILVSSFDNSSANNGFASYGNLGYLRRGIDLPNIGQAGARRIAGALAPWEVGFYNVAANFANRSQFANNPEFTADNNFRFFLRAPLKPVNRNDQSLNFLRDRINAAFNKGGAIIVGDEILAAFRANILSDRNFGLLFDFLQSRGHDRAHPIPDPILASDPAEEDLLIYAQSQGARYTVAGNPNRDLAQKRQYTSWNTTKTATNQDIPENSELGPNIGRAGYSVRFLNFQRLFAPGIATNDGFQEYSVPLAGFSPTSAGAEQVLQELEGLQH